MMSEWQIDDSKKRKRHDLNDFPSKMASYSYSTASFKTHLNPPLAPYRKPSERLQRPLNELDEFLSSDLELSFASTMSLNSPPESPVRTTTLISNTPLLPNMTQGSMAMDISPAPLAMGSQNTVISSATSGHRRTRPRAFTTARSFGRELTNHSTPLTSSQIGSTKGSNGKRLQRSALPSEWMDAISHAKVNQPPATSQAADLSDAMDVDCEGPPLPIDHPEFDVPTSPELVPVSAAPTITSFSNLFFDAASPKLVHMRPPKRRSLSPEASPRQETYRQRHSNEGAYVHPTDDLSSSPPPSSPSARKFERFASTGGVLFRKASRPSLVDNGAGSSASNLNKRPRRPTFSALMHEQPQPQTAYPIIDSKFEREVGPAALPPPRRAFSAMIAPAPGHSSPDDSNSLEGGLEFSSPVAQAFAKRQSLRTIRRRDGTDDFRPLTGAGMLRQHDMNAVAQSPLRKVTEEVVLESPSARWVKGPGLPGFGDNEAQGKILPCEKVTEDGLMRINVETLDDLLCGKFDDKITSYHIIDCRFDYEYEGGHIKGAKNINTTSEIEEFFLGEGNFRPSPTCSGDPCKKTILVFHCEFSCKRAPTFAKYLRSKDRSMNNHVYPRIHYPEVYILKGGYSQYFSKSAANCEPRNYVRMDDPLYVRDRREDLDQFRTKTRFGRTKSYAYGESSTSAGLTQQIQNSHRNTAPSGGVTSLFAAANAARTRRVAPPEISLRQSLSTLNEDAVINAAGSDDSLLDSVDGSPCPPPTAKLIAPGTMAMAMLKARRNSANSSRGPLQRAQTFTQCR